MIRRFVILGASGDLTRRYLLPAVAAIEAAGRLPEDLTILGVARDDWTREHFRSHIADWLTRMSSSLSPEIRERVLQKLEYRRADVGDARQLAEALNDGREPSVIYLALPPSLLCRVLEAIAALELDRHSRIVVEKPFGEDLQMAKSLNRLLHESFHEDNVYRIDHFLHKQTVQNILGLRFANRIFEPLWNALHIARVDITWDETLTLEGRAGYYDRTGALKDMIQNHLLQLLALIAMEPPRTLQDRDFRDRKIDALRAVTTFTPDDVPARTRRARYAAGRIADRDVPSYVNEPGVEPGRMTESFAEVCLTLENWRWAGVPFLLRTGKGLRRDQHEVRVTFKPVPHLAFGQAHAPHPNVLRLSLNPDRIAMTVNINGPGDPFDLEDAELEHTLANQDMPAYARLIENIMQGNSVLSIRDDEAEESWRIVEPIVQAWQSGDVPMLEYPAGSDGPTSGQHEASARRAG